MRTILLFLVAAAHCVCCANLQLNLRLNKTNGNFDIEVGSSVWFTSDSIKLQTAGKWYQPGDKSLELADSMDVQGSDFLGAYKGLRFTWKLAKNNVTFQTSIKTYESRDNVIIFEQNFTSGVKDVSVNNYDVPISVFPLLTVAQPLGFLHFYGHMAGCDFQSGVFPANFKGGLQGGPIAFFDKNRNAVVMSPLDNFFPIISNVSADGKSLQIGVQGRTKEIPPGFTFSYVLTASHGINDAFMSWGDILLQKYERKRVAQNATTVISYLGYATTAFYFYNPIDCDKYFGNYEDTLIRYKEYSDSLDIPFRYHLIDSWWYAEYYYSSAVWRWDDTKPFQDTRFPDGVKYTHEKLGLPFAAHLGKWLSNSPYTENPDFGFVKETEYAIPLKPAFYDSLFENATKWGLTTVKQDHINEQILLMNITLDDVYTVKTWLEAEGQGAAKHGISIEYCMDWSSILLTSLANPTGTHSRASGDYLPRGASTQWAMGTTSMFLWAIGLYPDKDTFYTTTNEKTMCKTAPFYNFTESHPWTHAIAAALSAGPITTSDGINGSDPVLIKRLARADGFLLKPDRPAINIESTWIARTFGQKGPEGEVITTFTQIDRLVWHYVFGVYLKSAYEVVASDLLSSRNGSYVAFEFNKTGEIEVVKFGPNGIKIPEGQNYGDAYLWILSPVLENGWVFLGESEKFISISKQRISNISVHSSGLNVTVIGTEKEKVNLSFFTPQAKVLRSSCEISSVGEVKFVVTGSSTSCV